MQRQAMSGDGSDGRAVGEGLQRHWQRQEMSGYGPDGRASGQDTQSEINKEIKAGTKTREAEAAYPVGEGTQGRDERKLW